MFTGIVQGRGRVASLNRRPGLVRMVLQTEPTLLQGLQRGASVAVNGACLTAVETGDSEVGFDLMMETLRVTNLGELKPGDEVNLERAARFGDEIGGHLLSGHIHGRARLLQRETPENNLRLLLEAPAGLERYLLPKGYVALDGVSLTLGEVDGGRFSVYLIPETLRVTTLGQRSPGEHLNLEIDTQTQAVVDTVERVLAERRGDDGG